MTENYSSLKTNYYNLDVETKKLSDETSFQSVENSWNNNFAANNRKVPDTKRENIVMAKTGNLCEGAEEDKSLMLKQLLGIVSNPTAVKEVTIKLFSFDFVLK